MSIITNKIVLGATDSVTTPYVDSISNSLNSSSTDQQIPTAKSVYTLSNALSKWKQGTMYGDGTNLYPTIVPSTITDIVRLPGFIMGATGNNLINGTITTITASSTDSKIPTAKACYTAINSAVSGLASTSYVNIAMAGVDASINTAINTAVAGLATENYVDNATNNMATTTYVNNAVSGLATQTYVNNAVSGLASITSTSVALGTTGWTLTGGYYQKSSYSVWSYNY